MAGDAFAYYWVQGNVPIEAVPNPLRPRENCVSDQTQHQSRAHTHDHSHATHQVAANKCAHLKGRDGSASDGWIARVLGLRMDIESIGMVRFRDKQEQLLSQFPDPHRFTATIKSTLSSLKQWQAGF